MDEDLEVHHDDDARPAATLNKVGDALPGLGIVAAVLGIVITMGASTARRPRSATRSARRWSARSSASCCRTASCSRSREPRAARRGRRRYEQCIKAGVLAVFKGMPPAIAVEFARRVAAATKSVRRFEETEKFCRASRGRRELAAAA